MRALVVPGVTDMNKGDQALVWESVRVAQDTELFDSVYILSSGDTEEEEEKLCSQSKESGYILLDNILPHPRRGMHKETEGGRDDITTLLLMVFFSVIDFLHLNFLLLVCNSKIITNLFFTKKTTNFINEFRTIDVVFVKGGGFIHSYGGFSSPYLIWFFLFYIRLAKRMKKKVIILPNSYGPFKGFTVSNQIRSTLKGLNLISARESVSYNAINELLNSKAFLSPDLGFYLEAESIQKEKVIDLLNNHFPDKQKRIVGITVRPWRFPGSEDPVQSYSNYISSVVELIRHIESKGYYVALCNQSIGPNAHEDDRNAIKDVLTEVPSATWINENLTCRELKLLYSHFEFFVGTRFHSVIFSLTSKVPSIAIGYGGNKAKGIMSFFELENYTVSIDDVESKQLIKMFDSLEINKNSLQAQLGEKLEDVFKQRELLIENIKKSIVPA